ncbi:MAG: SGNH/GDSL hydrolase family protein [Bacteroidota bacterium]|nr:SGNH/GDSL hydrolase family protein [Bacteroidota bacterium]
MMRYASFGLCVLLALCVGCSDEITPSGPNSLGPIDPSVYVAIGNSVTAGYQNGALYEGAQLYSYPKLIADRLGVSFVQPLISEPGTGERITLVSLNPIQLVTSEKSLLPVKSPYDTLSRPYDNLGIPGAVSLDATDETDFRQKSTSRGNPFFTLILRDQKYGKSVVKQALARQPTLVTFWLGNNDVLGFATSGGTSPSAPVPSNAFDISITSALTALRQGAPQAFILVGNIPDINAIPFFTTVGPIISAALSSLAGAPPGSVKLYYQLHGMTTGTDTTNFMRLKNVLIPLTGMTYVPSIGLPTGKWYRDLAEKLKEPLVNVIPSRIDTTKPFGLDPRNPWPDALVLDIQELTSVSSAIQAYNASIEGAINRLNNKPGQPNIALVNIRRLFNEAADRGITIAGETFTTQFISGGLFSFDGIHPSSKGQAIIANEFIRTMNETYGANIAQVDVSKIPGLPVPLAKNARRKLAFWTAASGVFDSIVRLMQP